MKSLGSRLKTVGPRVAKAPTNSDLRIAGRPLQARRLKLWTKDPHCVDCGRLTDYPQGFELDHEVPLEHGGPDTEANCRIRCVWFDLDGRKQGCHEAKTKRERKGGDMLSSKTMFDGHRAPSHAQKIKPPRGGIKWPA